ncbi:hypothetical protein PGB90_010137 [Kerria lacca]
MSYVLNCIIFMIFATVPLISSSTNYGFRCYICSTESDQNCGDPFNTTVNTGYIRKENCQPTYSPTQKYVCRKVKYHKPNNEISIYRSCEAESDDPCSPSQLNNYLKVEHCSTCTTDLCNSAPTLIKATSLLGPVLVFVSKITGKIL